MNDDSTDVAVFKGLANKKKGDIDVFNLESLPDLPDEPDPPRDEPEDLFDGEDRFVGEGKEDKYDQGDIRDGDEEDDGEGDEEEAGELGSEFGGLEEFEDVRELPKQTRFETLLKSKSDSKPQARPTRPPTPEMPNTPHVQYSRQQKVHEGLMALERMVKINKITLTRPFTHDDPPDVIWFEVDKQQEIIDAMPKMKIMQMMLKGGFKGIEKTNEKLFKWAPLSGLSKEMSNDMDQFSGPLDKLYKKHWKKGSTNPIMDLMLLITMAVAGYAMNGPSHKSSRATLAPSELTNSSFVSGTPASAPQNDALFQQLQAQNSQIQLLQSQLSDCMRLLSQRSQEGAVQAPPPFQPPQTQQHQQTLQPQRPPTQTTRPLLPPKPPSKVTPSRSRRTMKRPESKDSSGAFGGIVKSMQSVVDGAVNRLNKVAAPVVTGIQVIDEDDEILPILPRG